ncbi:MAG TPA: trypsin-like peptidase domain-containing protein [Jatrophihabitantaceae bacterium]|jgi:putative serine protease PepD|nr:trypsin-like peptidase domain-containing protein [Jatrophihabitantaceae bacterium]
MSDEHPQYRPEYWAQGPGVGQQPQQPQQPQPPQQGYPTFPLYGAPPPPPAPPGGGHGGHGGAYGGSPRRMVLLAAVVAAIVGGGIGAGTVALTDNGSSGSSAGLAYSTQQAPAAKTDGTVTAAARKIGPSVVTINVTSSQEQDTGSGVIIRQDGYILTNNHVISTAANGGGQIEVTFSDGKSQSAKVVGTDPSDDLAVIKVNASGLTAATFASSSALQVGQTVVAIGAPLGLSDTVTSGIVSNLARPVTTSDSNNDQASFDAIQTDAAINPGNSGGPLVNLNGDVVGVNAAIATDQSQGGLQVPGQEAQAGNIGIGFAIPSDEASRIAGELIKNGKATHAVMGVSVQDTQSGTSGALIHSVVSGSPADQAGLQTGDVVIRLDDQRIDEADALVAAVRSHAPGQKVSVTYLRGGDQHTATLTLGTGTD